MACMTYRCKEVFYNIIRYFRISNVKRIVQNLNVINHMSNLLQNQYNNLLYSRDIDILRSETGKCR